MKMIKTLLMALSMVMTTLAYSATYTVNSSADSGTGSLRQVLGQASTGDEIQIDGSLTIKLASTLTINNKEIKISAIPNTGRPTIVPNNGMTDTLLEFDSASHLLTVEGIDFKNAEDSAINIINAKDVFLLNSYFENNRAANNGGAIRANTKVLRVLSSHFKNNRTNGHGGAIYVGSSSGEGYVSIAHDIFESNSNSAGNGGAIYAEVGMRGFLINSFFSKNTALSGQGGAIHLGLNSDPYGNPQEHRIINSTFSENEANEGGGIYATDCPLQLYQVTLIDNKATSQGAAINMAKSTGNTGKLSVKRNTLINNRVNVTGTVNGEMIYSDTGVVEIDNSILMIDAPQATRSICGGANNVSAHNSVVNDNSCLLNGAAGSPITTQTPAQVVKTTLADNGCNTKIGLFSDSSTCLPTLMLPNQSEAINVRRSTRLVIRPQHEYDARGENYYYRRDQGFYPREEDAGAIESPYVDRSNRHVLLIKFEPANTDVNFSIRRLYTMCHSHMSNYQIPHGTDAKFCGLHPTNTYTNQYEVSHMVGACNGVRKTCSINNVTENKTVTMYLVNKNDPLYNVTKLVSPANGGSLSCNPTVRKGGAIFCTATPNAGYTLTSFSSDCVANPSSNNQCQRENIQSDSTVVATFTPINATVFNIEPSVASIDNGLGGTFTCDKSTATIADTVTCTATPNSNRGYNSVTFNNTECIVDTNNPNICRFSNLSGNQTIIASFVRDSSIPLYAITPTAMPSGTGTFSCDKSSATTAETVTCTATPDTSKGYVSVSFDNANCVVDVNNANVCKFTNLNADQNITATFSKTAQTYIITTAFRPADGGTFSCDKSSATATETVTCTATPDASKGYTSVSFDNASCVVDANNANVCRFTNLNASQMINATFTKTTPQNYSITTAFMPADGGTFSCDKSSATATETVTCTATPDASKGYTSVSFDNANCVVDANNANVCKFTNLNANQLINATFAKTTPQSYTIRTAFMPTEAGTFSCDKSSATATETVTCTATPDASKGYTSVSFDNANCVVDANNANVCKFANLNANQLINATFSKSQPVTPGTIFEDSFDNSFG